MIQPFEYKRRKTVTVQIGELAMGSNYPIRLQSMANTDTNDIENSVAQGIRIIEAGADLVRYTTQGIREAESARLIRAAIREKGYNTPLVADIHFNANAADLAARNVEKVRINPGNYVGSVKIGDNSDYTNEEFEREYQKIKDRFIPFLTICKQHNTAIRIGVNHGSLSERMMNRYGDTPQGMVASCLEFLEICREQEFNNVVISMKTSNTVMMVQTVRLLVDEMEKRDLHFPLHLGVTEAGDGEDGRIKSAVGIGALLLDGIGDTIRVSLSEEPEAEVPVARLLVDYCTKRESAQALPCIESAALNRYEYTKRTTHAVGSIGGNHVPVVIATMTGNFSTKPDLFVSTDYMVNAEGDKLPILPASTLDIAALNQEPQFIRIQATDLTAKRIEQLKAIKNTVLLLEAATNNFLTEMRVAQHTLLNSECTTPVIICANYFESELQSLQIKAAADLGVLLIDGFGDGILIENKGNTTIEQTVSVAFGILQATRVRITKTEYISCPSCGRTMFDLQSVIARIKARTSHLKGLKIGIMGCIVNGPGEMADADYGYVGAGRGKISLYKKKECVERNIPENEAVDKLVELIKTHGDWHD